MKRLLVAFMVALGLLVAVPGCVAYDSEPDYPVWVDTVPPGAVFVSPYTYYTVEVVGGVTYRHIWQWHAGYPGGTHGYHYHGRVRVR